MFINCSPIPEQVSFEPGTGGRNLAQVKDLVGANYE